LRAADKLRTYPACPRTESAAVVSQLTVSDSSTPRPGTWHDRLIVAGMAMLYTCSFYQRVAVPGVLFASIQSDLQWSAFAITGLTSVYLYIYAPGQFVTGYLADRFGGARVMLVGSLLLSVGAVGFPLCASLPGLYTFRVLVAIGSTVMYLCTMRELASRFDALWFSRLVGPVMFMGGLGGLLGTGPTAWLAQPLGWRGALLVAGMLTAGLSLALAVLFSKGGPPRRPVQPITWRVGRAALWNPGIRLLYLTSSTVFVCYFLFQAVIGPKYLQDVAGCSEVMASNITLGMQLLSMAVMLMTGSISVWFGHRRRPTVILQVSLVSAGVAVLLAATWLDLPLAAHAAGFGLLACSNGLMPLSVCATRDVSPAAAVAMVLAASNGLTYVMMALASNFAGVVLDAFAATRVDDVLRYPPQAYGWVLAALMAPVAAALAASLRFRDPVREPAEVAA
jgi:MFS family permease